jgi:hypothetical protein
VALVKCTECEHVVSDKAAACPRCGAPGPFHPQPTRVRLTRPSRFFGSLVPFVIEVDGEVIGFLLNRQTVEIERNYGFTLYVYVQRRYGFLYKVPAGSDLCIEVSPGAVSLKGRVWPVVRDPASPEPTA